MALIEMLQQNLAQRHAANLYRQRQVLDSPQGVVVEVDGRRYVNFSSNDYLGLANHPEVVRAFRAGAAQWGVGSGAAHLVTGHQAPHHALEEELAEFTGRSRALLFSTGYMANLGVVSALLGRGDTVYEDRLNHASLVDAGLLSRARLRRYRHTDATQLNEQLAQVCGGNKLIVTDGVFSMDGDLAPLPKLAHLALQHGAWLMVDDAHGLGVLDKKGRGSLAHYQLNSTQVPVLMGTLGKAFGTFGAFVAGSEELIETLIQQARSYIYTTALPPAVAEATRTSLRLVQAESWRREKLLSLVTRFRTGAAQLGHNLPVSETPIQPLLLGDAANALQVSQRLREAGILISAIRPPTVPEGSARLRITFCAEHTEEQVDGLLDALATCRVSP
ncbi:MAG: 8-amino-7-oxononanoate synthase [Proteobacteria bacterium]|jgi:8-amino-7-oxononanoate synthase|nr:8-amino-7-oxononanoate synthase [Pseudomonadota bacterium]